MTPTQTLDPAMPDPETLEPETPDPVPTSSAPRPRTQRPERRWAVRVAAAAQEAPPQPAPAMEEAFRDPPQSARPRVWWHWMNGNISKDGIAKDLEWMKRVGIGGLQNFDANLNTPQVVDKRLVYMTPEWKDAFRFAARKADSLDLELAIARGFTVLSDVSARRG